MPRAATLLAVVAALLAALTLFVLTRHNGGTATSPTRANAFRIAFGSCNKHDRPQIFWPFMQSRSPSVFAWLGDIIYADKGVVGKWRLPGTLDDTISYFALQKARPDYTEFVRHVPAIIGVWDDHDFGKNDGDKHFNIGQLHAQYLWDFLDEPRDSPRRLQSGVWSSHVFDAHGRRIRIILLDNRTHRDSHGLFPGVTHDRDNDAQDMLGEEQWAWLERELTDTRADVTIIGAGVQIVADDKAFEESFSQFPGSQAKLLSLISATNTSHVVFISGDVHMAEINAVQCEDMAYAWHDFTSSGLTHSIATYYPRWFVSVQFAGTRRITPMLLDLNVGEIDIEWDNDFAADAVMTMRALGSDSTVHIEHKIPLSHLQFSSHAPSSDIIDCARASLHAGLPESCRRVLHRCDKHAGPRWKWALLSAYPLYFIFAPVCFLMTLFGPIAVMNCPHERRATWLWVLPFAMFFSLVFNL